MNRRRAGIAVIACALVVAMASPPRLRANLDVHLANPAAASVQRLELGIAGLSVMITVTVDAVTR